ncbi:hypothetical protein [Glycomyces tritici]|uniref:Uncharacterized protein n=1 Tax=Glycomyces tritici TaxID=2665176 RepID=A0ABT7YT00_9ACTN|nr:hypothetical protein [Glycomyces tritici]MDN3241733.1 hypothetical protein [Glycomyces tritici]
MGFFKRRSGRARGGVAADCDFCGRSRPEATVRVLRGAGYGKPPEHACTACEAEYDRLASRFARAVPPHGLWLMPDTGTERVMAPVPDAFESVHSRVRELMRTADDVSPAAARITVLRNSVFGAPDPSQHSTYDEAVEAISRGIARGLEQGFELNREFLGLSRFSLALHGGGVLSFQEVLRGGHLQSQHCHLIDTRTTLHTYHSYHR